MDEEGLVLVLLPVGEHPVRETGGLTPAIHRVIEEQSLLGGVGDPTPSQQVDHLGLSGQEHRVDGLADGRGVELGFQAEDQLGHRLQGHLTVSGMFQLVPGTHCP